MEAAVADFRFCLVTVRMGRPSIEPPVFVNGNTCVLTGVVRLISEFRFMAVQLFNKTCLVSTFRVRSPCFTGEAYDLTTAKTLKFNSLLVQHGTTLASCGVAIHLSSVVRTYFGMHGDPSIPAEHSCGKQDWVTVKSDTIPRE